MEIIKVEPYDLPLPSQLFGPSFFMASVGFHNLARALPRDDGQRGLDFSACLGSRSFACYIAAINPMSRMTSRKTLCRVLHR